MYFITFWKTVASLTGYFIRERKKESAHAFSVIEALEEQFNGAFDAFTRKKIAKYHSVYNPLIVDSFCRLRGRVTTIEERKRLIYYFVASSLLDNFFDHSMLSNEEIEQICFNTKDFIPKNFDEKVGAYCHSALLDFVKDKAHYTAILREEVDAQRMSLQQFDENVPDEVIERIMKAKGGNGVLMCAFYLDHTASPLEEQCWHQVGVITQLSNDLYDIHKDLTEGISTLATRCTDAWAMEKYVEQHITHLKDLIRQLPVTKKVQQRFAIEMIGLSVLAIIAVEKLKKLQGTSHKLPDFRTLERKQLITDMEKPGNKLRWFKYMYQYARL